MLAKRQLKPQKNSIHWRRLSLRGRLRGRRNVLSFHTATLVGNSIIVLGGYPETYETSQRIYTAVFDVSTNTWNQDFEDNSAPHDRFGHTTVLIEDNLFLLGGLSDGSTSQEFWAFDLILNLWEQLPNDDNNVSPGPCFAHTAEYLQEIDAHVVINRKGLRNKKNIVYLYERDRKLWKGVEAKALGPSLRSYQSSCATRAKLFIYGGFSGTYLGGLFILTFKSPSHCYWESVNDMHIPACFGSTLTYVDGTVFMFGGLTERGEVNTLYTFDLRQYKWDEKHKLNPENGISPRRNHTVVKLRNRLLCFGGYEKDCNGVFELRLSET